MPETVRRVARPKAPEAEVEGTKIPPSAAHVTVEDIDAVLDEIDEVLEENAEEFVRNYVQKGGQ